MAVPTLLKAFECATVLHLFPIHKKFTSAIFASVNKESCLRKNKYRFLFALLLTSARYYATEMIRAEPRRATPDFRTTF